MNSLTEPGVTPRAQPGVVPQAADPIESFLDREYSAGFVTEIESVTIPKGLSEDTIRLLSSKKGEPEFMLEWRLAAYRPRSEEHTSELQSLMRTSYAVFCL